MDSKQIIEHEKSGSRSAVFTVVDLLVLIVFVGLGVLILMAIPTHHLSKAPRVTCQNNLKQLGLAFVTWDGDYGDRYPMSVAISNGGRMGSVDAFRSLQVMSNEINNPHILVCPSDNRKDAGSFAKLNNANVSYFVGLDADERFPHMILSGDRNLMTNGVAVSAGLAIITSNTPLTWSATMHSLAGNVGLADGSVQQSANVNLQQLFEETETNVNRLAVP